MGDTVLWILISVGDAALVWWLIRDHKRRKYHSSDLKYGRKYSGAHELDAIATRLEDLEQSIIQIELAKVHKMKGVTVQIPDALSQQHESTIIIDGRNNSSRFLLESLNAEKLRLREEFDKKLERLYRTGSTETITGECLSSLSSLPCVSGSSGESFLRKKNDSSDRKTNEGAIR